MLRPGGNYWFWLVGLLFATGCANKTGQETGSPALKSMSGTPEIPEADPGLPTDTSSNFSVAPDTMKVVEAPPVNDTVYVYVGKEPEFPGGQTAFNEFLKNNMKLAKPEPGEKTWGKVVITFVVTPTGEITQPQIYSRPSREFDKEALRLLEIMPRWNPGKHKGKPVNVRVYLPIIFDNK